MVKNGETPPDIKDINDKPLDPQQKFDIKGKIEPKPKVFLLFIKN